jgi:DNA-binding MarR family transcriptional regulator
VGDPQWLDETESRAWHGYRRLRLLLDAQVNRDLVRESGLSEPDYEVLSHLSESPEQRDRLNALAARMLWSRSRLSHHLTRMEKRGLVTRQECPSDARGAFVVLTEGGRQAIAEATPGRVASVRRHFLDLLSAEQLTLIADLADQLSAHLTGRDDRQTAAP